MALAALRSRPPRTLAWMLGGLSALGSSPVPLADPSVAVAVVPVEGQPLAANVQRVAEALAYLGAPLPAETRRELTTAGQARDGRKLQEILDPGVLFVVHVNPEARVKLERGPAPAALQQAGYTPVLVKVVNESGGTQRLRIGSPQSGPVYAGVAELSMERQRQEHLRENENTGGRTDRFLDVEMFASPPMTPKLSGLDVEYAVALIYSSEAGRREATITFDAGQGTQDVGFRAELPVLFDVGPAVPVRLTVLDHDGAPTTGRFLFLDRQGHVFPPQAKRLAPDLFFQRHIYRAHGETVLLPPGELTMFYGRGPEYRWLRRMVAIPRAPRPPTRDPAPEIAVKLERWVDPAARGFYSGDHHVHAAGCAHYSSPTEGVDPAVIFRQAKGEALNVASVLTWGPGFDHQKQFFASTVDRVSEPLTRLKYDVEVSGFGSQALGHVVLLNLREQIYPGATGTRDWPTWTLPVESARGLLPEPPAATDANRDGFLTEAELVASHHRVADELPNLAIPELDSVGAQEIFVTAALGVCDFISAMDTDRISEWNAWYHLMNCGFPVSVGGETDFPCMIGTRVGQGRTYVQLGKQSRVDIRSWYEGLAGGRSYVSDGYAHALEFRVDGRTSGDEIHLALPDKVTVQAKVAFSPETPLEAPYGGVIPVGGRRFVGDTVIMRETQAVDPLFERGQRLVELVVNGRVVASQEVPADGREHAVQFAVPIDRSSWVALRQFPELHTNPVRVLVGGRPIRASRQSARWALGCVDQLWRARGGSIAARERDAAQRAYEEARTIYRRIAEESPPER